MPRRFSHRLRVRYVECDPQNVVFNSHYVAWFDILMTELWREVPGGYAGMMEAGTDMVVAEVGVRYLGAAHFDDEVDLSASVSRLGNTGMTTDIEVLRGGEVLAEGELRHVFIDLGTKEKKRIPDDVRRALEPYLEPATAPGLMLHLRIVAPRDPAKKALDLLVADGSVWNVVHMPGVASKPQGDVILADVAREDASLVLHDLRQLKIPETGSISVDAIDTQLSEGARRAEKHAPGLPSDAVVWEEVEARTQENTELSAGFVAFMILACLIAAAGILLDQPILIVGAMVVGPEFGPLVGVSVALVELRAGLARRSLTALAVGFPAGTILALLATLGFKGLGIVPEEFNPEEHELTGFISQPNFFSFFVAFVAGIAGVLSLTSAKSGALIGVLVSVTTIPAAANVGVATAYGAAGEALGAAAQLGINLCSIVLAAVLTLYLQRRLYVARRRKHLGRPTSPEDELLLRATTRRPASSERAR